MNKASVVKWVIASPFILIGIGIAFCEANKAYWDYQVKQMCEKDGGVTVFEKVEVSRAEYPNLNIQNGILILPSDRHIKKDDPFFSTFKSETLYDYSPTIFRFEQSMIRSNDNKELSKLISYGRRGGDFPTGIFHDSSFSCGNEEENLKAYQETFTIKGE